MRDSQKDLHKKLLGRSGERTAEKLLNKKGLRTLERNYRTPFGEADLVLGKGDLVVFCEVKTRTDGAFGAGREAVNDKKRERYVKIASYYLAERGLSDAQVRFDVVEVQGGAPEHIENAFFA